MFATQDTIVHTREGAVTCRIGDALVTGVQGERWPIRRAYFESDYLPVPPNVMGKDGLYHKAPQIVDASRVTCGSSVELEGGQGVLKAGVGDWILTGSDGRRWVVADEIFQDTYVVVEPMTKE
ncbi:MAG: PGDYG domain-containing protein [Rhodocyclaceae bacterium]|nr:PGDYG domain-containing protein [Rhodocyclaceae bacterium]